MMAGAGQSTDTSVGALIACIVILSIPIWLFLVILPYIHYLIGIAFLLLLIASIPFCISLAAVTEVRDALNQQLKNTRFTTNGYCGIIDKFEIDWENIWPRLALAVTVYRLDFTNEKGETGKLLIGGINNFKGSSKGKWAELATSLLEIEPHSDLSAEAKSVELLAKCIQAIRDGDKRTMQLKSSIEELSNSISLCNANPLLSPSKDNIEGHLSNAKRELGKIQKNASKISSKVKILKEYLSLPKTVRAAIASGVTEAESDSEHTFAEEFQELVELTQIMDSLTDGRVF